jgi:repressor LexA
MDNSKLTKKQQEVLLAIKDLILSTSMSPTLEEIREYMGYGNTSSVQRHIEPLIQKGYLTSQDNVPRSLRLVEQKQTTLNIPLVGNVACGKPIYAEENIEAYIPYPKSKVGYSVQDLFFLRATGDSMNEAEVNSKTIANWDFVLVHKQSTADTGSIVVALIGDEATIKYFKKDSEKGAYILEPKSSNKKHKPLLLIEDFYIQGTILDVIKRR